VNRYGVFILVALVADFAVARIADVFNLHALAPEPRRMREYTAARIRLDMVAATLELALLLGFWFAGGFGWLDRAVRGLALGPIPTGLLFLGALGLGHTVFGVPLRWWSTFVIETRFGFNTTTPRTFWTDLLKGLALAVALGGPLLAVVLWLFGATDRAWLWCWAVSATFVVAIQYVVPTWILPLFNRFTPLPDGPYRSGILAYARDVAFPLEDVFVIDGSRRSTKANALFTGFGRHKRVALFDTLLEKLDAGEVVAVVAHEVGHYRLGHVVWALLFGIVQMGALFFLLSRFLGERALFAAFSVAEPSVHVGLVLFALLLTPIERVVSIGLHAWSRRNERAADAFAARTTGAAGRLASALERLSTDALSNPTPHPLYVALHYSHPPVRDRIRALGSLDTRAVG
jgi:STE24 endopeptidase